MIGGIADNSVAAGVHAATIAGGGRSNPASAATANRVTDNHGTVGGGGNQAGDGAGTASDREYATVGGGVNDTASGQYATVGGGYINTASGQYATVPGGAFNSAGNYSFAAGSLAHADSAGSFVFGDGTAATYDLGPNEFIVRSTGGVRFYTGAGTATGATLAAGSGSWGSLSDRRSKTAITPLSGRAVLSKLVALPVSKWSYRAQGTKIRHAGPMAQDFYRTFGLGESRRYIDTVDSEGVALAAIKGLAQENGRLKARLAQNNRRSSRSSAHQQAQIRHQQAQIRHQQAQISWLMRHVRSR